MRLRVTCENLQRTPALESSVRDHVRMLEEIHRPILGCHVIIERSVFAHNETFPFDITVELKVTGCEICAHRASREDQCDLYVALRDTFEVAKRLLQDHERACGCLGARASGFAAEGRARPVTINASP